MTTDDTEGTYFKYLPFGEDEEGRKMPHKIEKDEFQRNHIRLGFGQTYARPTSVGADRQGTRTALPGRCRRGRTTANVPLRNQSAETAGGIHLPSARRPCLRTLSADLDAGGSTDAARRSRFSVPRRWAKCSDATCATSTRNYPTKSNGWKSIRPGTPYCSKTARSRCGAFPCVTASPPPATCSGRNSPR